MVSRVKLGGLVIISILPVIITFFQVGIASAQGPVVKGPSVGPLVRPSSFKGDLRQLPQVAPKTKPRQPRMMTAPRNSSSSVKIDPVVQTKLATALMPTPSLNFDGLDRQSAGDAGLPPDPNGDVNLNYFVQAAVMGLGIYDKATGSLVVTTTIQSLWSSAYPTPTTPCDMSPAEDPVVLYDTIAQRWIVTEMAWLDTISPTLPSNFYQCVAVSQTDNPVTGGWNFYPFLIEPDKQLAYSKLAIWSDGYYMSSNMFTPWDGSATFLGVNVWAMDRTAMINGAPTSIIKFWLPCGTPCYASLLPSNLRGTSPPSGTPNFFASIDAPNTLHLWKFHVDWTTPSNSWFGSTSSNPNPTNLTVASFSGVTDPFMHVVPQNSVSQPFLQSFAERLMMHLQYRNIGGVESLWVNHSVYSNSVLGLRWYEIRDPNTTPTINQQATFQPDSNWRWMGSLAIDHDGNMALGYSISSATMFPGIRYAGRLISDPPNTLGQGEQILFDGTGPESDPPGWGAWGDYSGMIVDSVDDCTFWYTSEYFDTTPNVWRTRIGSFKIPSCSPSHVPQTITFDPIPDHLVNDPPFLITATSSSNLPVTLNASGECNVNSSTVTLTGIAGTCAITATQSGDATYAPAPSVTRSFNVTQITQTITFNPLPNRLLSQSPFTVSASATSGLTVYFTASGPCNASGTNGTTITLTGLGNCTVTAHQDGNAIYVAAVPVARTFVIKVGLYLPLIFR